MKRICLVIVASLFVSLCMAQSDFKYSSPEQKGLEPVAVDASTAKSESAKAVQACGYSQVFYTKRDLDYLMDLSDCVGIRFYNAKNGRKNQQLRSDCGSCKRRWKGNWPRYGKQVFAREIY